MFVDYIKIRIKAGNGGDGATSFRREKYIPDGGPDGGDGGNGGSVYFEQDKDSSTLMAFRWNKLYKAEDGTNGSGNKCKGKQGSDLVIKVPVGTVVSTPEGKVLADLSGDNKKVLVLKGGKGGLGNVHFKSSTRQAPNFSIDGDKTKEFEVVLELKSIADVGLLGFPNAGKSTLLSKISAARPKIANYPFTTLEPNLGIAKDKYGRSFVVADIPGIIEGASTGVGLGLKFLRHIERCRILLHVVDSSSYENSPIESLKVLNAELEKYGKDTVTKKQILCINKVDLENEEEIQKLEDFAKENDIEYIKISGATGYNLDNLLVKIADKLETIPKQEVIEADYSYLNDFEDSIDIQVVPTENYKNVKTYQITGQRAEKIVGRINIDDNESMHYFHRMLDESGITKRLKKMGIQEGDIVNMCGTEFEWVN